MFACAVPVLLTGYEPAERTLCTNTDWHGGSRAQAQGETRTRHARCVVEDVRSFGNERSPTKLELGAGNYMMQLHWHNILIKSRITVRISSTTFCSRFNLLSYCSYKFQARRTFLLICYVSSIFTWQACLPMHLASILPLCWLLCGIQLRTSPAVLCPMVVRRANPS